MEEPAEHERAVRSVRWCGKERDLEEPAEYGRVVRSVRWRDEERGLEEPKGGNKASKSEQ